MFRLLSRLFIEGAGYFGSLGAAGDHVHISAQPHSAEKAVEIIISNTINVEEKRTAIMFL